MDRPSFTFIGHNDDLTSKRIKDVNARKKIRSHVMRDVRRRERLAGFKRVSRRESRIAQAGIVAGPTQCELVADPDEQTLVLRAPSQSSASSIEEYESGDSLSTPQFRRGRPVRWSAGYPCSNPQSFPGSWFLDPFSALPGTSELPSTVAHLVFYCKSCGLFCRSILRFLPVSATERG